MDSWKRLSFLPLSELRQLQKRRLRYFISRQLYPFSPYYQRLFKRHKIEPRHIRSVKDLGIIPFTKKEDLLPTQDNPQRFLDFVLKPERALIKKHWPKTKLFWLSCLGLIKGKEHLKHRLEREYRPIFLTATTGTTNQPVSFLYSHFDIENLKLYGYRLLEVFAAQENMRAVNLFPYAPHLAFWQTVFAGLRHNNFVLSTGGGKVMGTQANIETVLKVRPDVLIGVPSYIYHLVRTACEEGKDFSFVQKVILGAQAVPLGFKEKLANLLKKMGARHIRILGTYGFTEAKCAWAECPTPLKVSSGYHTYPDKEVFEVIDPETGQVRDEDCDGELVYSNIDARASCVLRYRTGDIVKGGITSLRCPYCKRTVPRISSQITRSHHIKNLMLSKIKGTLVNLNTLEAILEQEREIEQWQVEIRKKDNDPYEVDELIIYVSLSVGVKEEGLKERLKDKIHTATEVTPNQLIVLPYREMLERIELESGHKAKQIVDRRPR